MKDGQSNTRAGSAVPHPMVCVKWFDSSKQGGEVRLGTLRPYLEIYTAGFLVREDDETISTAEDWITEEECWRNVSHIPKVNVLAIERFGKAKGKQ